MATDGRRLALVDLEVEFPSGQETEIIVSTKAVTEIQRLLREEGEVKLSIHENQIAFELNHRKVGKIVPRHALAFFKSFSIHNLTIRTVRRWA